MPSKPSIALDPKHIGAGLAAIGILAMAMAGYVKITTPEAQQCQIELADARARLELLTEAKDACKEALNVCVRPAKESP